MIHQKIGAWKRPVHFHPVFTEKSEQPQFLRGCGTQSCLLRCLGAHLKALVERETLSYSFSSRNFSFLTFENLEKNYMNMNIVCL